MIKRTRYTGNNGYSYIIDELRKRLGNETAEKIVDDTVTYGNELWKEYDHLSKKGYDHSKSCFLSADEEISDRRRSDRTY